MIEVQWCALVSDISWQAQLVSTTLNYVIGACTEKQRLAILTTFELQNYKVGEKRE